MKLWLPFGGSIVECGMKGSLLRQTLEAGTNNEGNADFLQWGMIEFHEIEIAWYIHGSLLHDSKLYHIALPDIMLLGNKKKMAFLKAAQSDDVFSTTNQFRCLFFKFFQQPVLRSTTATR